MKISGGCTRLVIIVWKYAIKLPRITYGWKMFLQGLLANMQEAQWGRCGFDGLCPVFFVVPGGWLIVMQRAEPLTDVEWASFDPEIFCERFDYLIPAEPKQDSFGKLNGKVVAIDYGN